MIHETQLKIGLPVVANQEFSGVPAETSGTVVERESSWPEVPSVAIQWHRTPDDELVDWFSLDELQYLDVGGHERIGGLPIHISMRENPICIVCGIDTGSGLLPMQTVMK